MHLRHLNSTPKSFHYAVTIHEVTGLDSLLDPPATANLAQPPFRPLDPFTLTISSRSKRNQTRIAVLQHDTITFDEQITFDATLFGRSGGRGGEQRFDKKVFAFSLVNVRLQSDKVKRFAVHSTQIDLAQYASLDEETESCQSFVMQAEKGVDGVKGPELRLTIQSKCMGDGAASEASLLSVMGRTSRSRSTSQIRAVEDSKQRRWKERRDAQEEEEEVSMRRREREEEGSATTDALTSPHEYRVKLDMINDDDAEDREDTLRARRKQREEVEEEAREADEESQTSQELAEKEEQTRKRREKRRTFDAEDILRPSSPSSPTSTARPKKPDKVGKTTASSPTAMTSPLSIAMPDIITTLHSGSSASNTHPASKTINIVSLFDLSSPSHLASLHNSFASAQRGGFGRSRLMQGDKGMPDANEAKRPAPPPPATTSSSSATVSAAPLAVYRPPVPSIRVNVHLPPQLNMAERNEHERRYRQRMEPRLTFVLSTLFPSSLFTCPAYVTSLSSLSTLPSSPCIFFASYSTLRLQQEFDLEQRENEDESRSRAMEQYQYLQMNDKQRAQWKKNRDTHAQSELTRLNTLTASRMQRRQREEADSQQRAVEHTAMADEMRAVGEEWNRHGYSVSGVALWRLVNMCEMCCVDDAAEAEVKQREDDGTAGGKKRKAKGKQKEEEEAAVLSRLAHRAWMLEMVLRLLRRRVEESRDHYGELLWHINALLILQRSLRRRRESAESTADNDQYSTLLVQAKDWGVALPVNGKIASRPISGTSTPAEVSSGSSSFLPYYPFIASASSFPFASLDYNRAAISTTLTPLGFLLHHTTSFLRSLFSLLFHHLSFAISYRLPMSSILTPTSFSLETILDFLTDVHSFLVLSQLQAHLRLCVVHWLLEAVSARIVNAVMFEVKRMEDGGTVDHEHDAYELPLAPILIHRMTSQPLPANSPTSANPSAASAAFSMSHPQLPALPSLQLFADASSFLSLGMRLMMIYTALRDWMQREQYTADEREQLCDALLPLHSLAMFCLIEKTHSNKWRRECGGLSDAQVLALCRLYEKVGGEKVGEGWMKAGKGKAKVDEGDVWVEWPGVVEVQLDWSVVPFAAQSVLLPRVLREAPPSSVVDGLLDADVLIIT